MIVEPIGLLLALKWERQTQRRFTAPIRISGIWLFPEENCGELANKPTLAAR